MKTQKQIERKIQVMSREIQDKEREVDSPFTVPEFQVEKEGERRDGLSREAKALTAKVEALKWVLG